MVQIPVQQDFTLWRQRRFHQYCKIFNIICVVLYIISCSVTNEITCFRITSDVLFVFVMNAVF